MTTKKRLKAMVVDDTVFYRKIVSDALAAIPEVEVVGTANNGKIALSRIATLQPDLITLDIEMPEMTGLEVLAAIKERSLNVAVVMLSSLTQQGSDMTIKALELGAFDFLPKPNAGSFEANKKAVDEALNPIVKAFLRRWEITSILKGKTAAKAPMSSPASAAGRGGAGSDIVERMAAVTGQKRVRAQAIAIGISTGGPMALTQMMPLIPGDLGVPILIVQHMPPMFTKSLATSLDAKCAIKVVEAQDGQPVEANTAYIAPGGKQMKIVAASGGSAKIIRITDDPPENNCRPSADYLFKSIAYAYKEYATGVIMTGMGSDGTLGLKLMKRFGATVIAQDEATCVVYGMPKAPVEAGIVDVISPLDQIAAAISRTVNW